MPDLALLLAFTAATVLLMLIPGPNVALIVANSLRYGSRTGLLTVLGSVTGVIPALAAVGLGMAGVLNLASQGFAWLRWAGVVYLVVLGLRSWFAAEPPPGPAVTPPRSASGVYLQAALISITNPKTLLFLGAFLPQFVTTRAPVLPQLGLLAAIYLTVMLVVDGGWALLAGRLRRWLHTRFRLRARITGALLVGAGAGLALARGR